MLGRRRRTPVARYVVENGAHLVQHTVALRKMPPLLQRDPSTLVFAIATLNLFMHTLLHLALEDSGSGGLVIVGYFEDVRCIDPIISPPAHDMVAVDIALIHRNLGNVSKSSRQQIFAAVQLAVSIMPWMQAVAHEGIATHITICCRVDFAIGRRGHFHHSMSKRGDVLGACQVIS